MNIESINVKDLVLSPLNVRTNVEDATDIEQLACSIEVNGLLQPLVVHKVKGKKYGVIAGGRRLRALEHIKYKGVVPCQVLNVTEAELVAASITENFVRKDMRPYEIYQAFAQVQALDPDVDDAKLAEIFGLPLDRTRRILRLAHLHPDVFAAYREGRIDDKQARAYAATEDQTLQLEVFTAMSKGPQYNHTEHAIRRALGHDDREQLNMLKIVGRGAYTEAGGRFEIDLFATHEGGKVLDPEILASLYREKLHMAQATVAAEHPDEQFTFVEGPPQGRYGPDYQLRIYPKRDAPTDEQQARLEELARIIEDGEDDDEIEAASAEYDEIEASLPYVLPAGPKLAHVEPLPDGFTRTTFYWPDEATRKAAIKAVEGQQDITPALVQQTKDEALTGRASDWLRAERQAMLRREILTAPYSEGWKTKLYLYTMLDSDNLLPAGSTFEDFTGFKQDELDYHAAVLFSRLIGRHLTRADDIAVKQYGAYVAAHPRDLWTPTADFFDLFKKVQLLAFATEIGGLEHYVNSNMKLGEIKDRLLAITTGTAEAPGVSEEAKANAQAWVPKWLRFEDARASVPAEQSEAEDEDLSSNEYPGVVTDPAGQFEAAE